MDAWLAGDPQASLAPTERGAALARSLGDPRWIALFEGIRGFKMFETGRPQEALVVLAEAVEWAEGCGDPPIWQHVLTHLGEAYLLLGDARQAHKTFERTLEVAERMRNWGLVAYLLGHLSAALAQLGRWPEARQHAERAVEIARLEARSWSSALPLIRMGDLCILEGAWEDAADSLAQGMAVAVELDDPQFQWWGRSIQAELALMQGHVDQALSYLEPVEETLQRVSVPLIWTPLARVYLETGALDRAEDVIRLGTEQALALQLPLELVPWLRLQAVLLTTEQRWDEAEQAFREAVALPGSLPYPYAEALARYEWGRMELQRGQPEQARALLEEALVTFQQLGARPYVEWTEQALTVIAGTQTGPR
jgi:tetratricopeptide (TPR) repeat protein